MDQPKGQIVAITSGKGGVGKSTLCCYLGRALAHRGETTIILELDSGLRSQDIMLGVTNTVYDFGDVLAGHCSLKDAVHAVPDCDRLFLLSAPAFFERFPDKQEMAFVCRALRKRFDYILIDSSAGYGVTKALSSVADQVLLVATPDPVCVRDVALMAQTLRENGVGSIRLVINKLSHQALRKKLVKNLDQVIDQIGVQLIGVLSEQQAIFMGSAQGKPLPDGSFSSKLFDAIAGRMQGEQIPLLIHS